MVAQRLVRIKSAMHRFLSEDKELRQPYSDQDGTRARIIQEEIEALHSVPHELNTKHEAGPSWSLPIMRSAATIFQPDWTHPTRSWGLRIGILSFTIMLITGLGWWTQHEVSRAANAAAAEYLRGNLDSVSAAIKVWSDLRLEMLKRLAADPSVRTAILASLEAFEKTRPAAPIGFVTPEASQYLKLIGPWARNSGYASWGILNRDFRVVASSESYMIGSQVKPRASGLDLLVNVFLGESVVIMPHLYGEKLSNRAELPLPNRVVVQFAVPVRNDEGQVQAVLITALESKHEFQPILSQGSVGRSTEIYAFNDKGIMISESRFNKELIEKSLIGKDRTSTLNVHLTEGPSDTPTKLAKAAMDARNSPTQNNKEGILTSPYLDYRGVEVIGAWRWLPEYNIGLAAETDLAEISLPLSYLRLSLGIQLALLGFFLASAILATTAMLRLGREVAARKRIGNYKIIRKIGEGGVGEVFLAKHDLLKRPTAIKILKPNVTNPSTLQRFEREVQLTCCLTQPHIITIYDYGHTTSGVFYYAMEYLRGIDLGRLLRIEGQIPYGRGIHILLQVCRALQAAHANGLIHRDIKPENVMITQYGTESDYVKVVDFGLAKEITLTDATKEGMTQTLQGTPLYIAPERFRDPDLKDDARIDIYALGAMAYKMFSGRNLFSAATETALVYEILHTEPRPLSALCKDCSTELSNLIMSCVARDPNQRPSSMDEIIHVLQSVHESTSWTDLDSVQWWSLHPELLSDDIGLVS